MRTPSLLNQKQLLEGNCPHALTSHLHHLIATNHTKAWNAQSPVRECMRVLFKGNGVKASGGKLRVCNPTSCVPPNSTERNKARLLEWLCSFFSSPWGLRVFQSDLICARVFLPCCPIIQCCWKGNSFAAFQRSPCLNGTTPMRPLRLFKTTRDQPRDKRWFRAKWPMPMGPMPPILRSLRSGSSWDCWRQQTLMERNTIKETLESQILAEQPLKNEE